MEVIDPPGDVRPPSCLGCYSPDPRELRLQIRELFTAPGGPGLPRRAAAGPRPGRLRAVMVPHMDYARGGVTYGHGYRELAEAADPESLFVVVGTAHHSYTRFALTRQHFATPLGLARTDRDAVDRLAWLYGEEVYEDPDAHAEEHSIELEVVLLQHLFGGGVRIVPLLAGSVHDAIQLGQSPIGLPDVRWMIGALRTLEAEHDGPLVYVISGDLAHIGPKFDDPEPVDDGTLRVSGRRDRVLLSELERADADGFFGRVAAERDERRICGLAPAYAVLKAIDAKAGRVLHYRQFVAPDRSESVSFASVAFYG